MLKTCSWQDKQRIVSKKGAENVYDLCFVPLCPRIDIQQVTRIEIDHTYNTNESTHQTLSLSLFMSAYGQVRLHVCTRRFMCTCAIEKIALTRVWRNQVSLDSTLIVPIR